MMRCITDGICFKAYTIIVLTVVVLFNLTACVMVIGGNNTNIKTAMDLERDLEITATAKDNTIARD